MQKIKGIIRVVFNVLIYLFLIICLSMIIFLLAVKNNADSCVEVFNYQARIVVSQSMENCEKTDVSEFEIKSIPIYSLIIIENIPEDKAKADEWCKNLKVGDVLTFKYVYVKQETITHRITKISEKQSGGYKIELMGDNKIDDALTMSQIIDTSIPDSPNYLIGKVIWQSPFLGKVVSDMQKPTTLICMVTLLCGGVIVYEVIRIVSAFYQKKSREEKVKLDEREREFELMKQELEQLKKKI